MCGIVGVVTDVEAKGPSLQSRRDAQEAASRLLRHLEQAQAEEISQHLSPLGEWIRFLPSAATSFLFGVQPSFEAEIHTLLAALQKTLACVQAGQEKAKGFQELEHWNQLSIQCRDLIWRLEKDLLEVQAHLTTLLPAPWKEEQRDLVRSLWEIEFVLRGLHRLEIRGRDSGGIVVQVHFPSKDTYDRFVKAVAASPLATEWSQRLKLEGLVSRAICGPDVQHGEQRNLLFLYKVASEVGSIGQNIRDLRSQIQKDEILRRALSLPSIRVSPLCHTRWASNGIINDYNAHPQGNDTEGMTAAETRLFAVLNGDIDNYKELLDAWQRRTGQRLPSGVTTDAKIIPLLVEERFRSKGDLREAFLEVLRDFRGSFAIALRHLDFPDTALLGIGGSGQSLYVGIHAEAAFFASELYGLVEGTSRFVKLDGEKEREGGNPNSRGQVLEIRRDMVGQKRPFLAWSFDGVPLEESHLPLQNAQITTRDIDIAGYPHFFLKEISESVQTVRKTLHGRFFLKDDPAQPFVFNLDESIVPESLIRDLSQGRIKHVFCIGQGTAAVAAMGVANALRRSLGSDLDIRATKATELSGHMLSDAMEDVLAIAVSQSGTTTDTNRTVDLLRQRGGRVLAILNRRNSDLAFKSDGVIFTSDGRDVEMSVASTKAFYSQVTAGALLSLYLGYRTGHLTTQDVHKGLQELVALPGQMETVLALSERIRETAETYALKKRYWAVVGSGPNHIAAQEIRIKLSELCYKSMSCDFIEDKKHIDLSAEPLMLVCATGLDEANLSDSVKEVSIFKAHRSIPLVIASRGADRFQAYATAVFEVPDIPPHLAPILATIVGHLFGYHAACAIHQQSIFLRRVRSALVSALPALENHPETLLSPQVPSELRSRLQETLTFLQSPAVNSSLEVDTATRALLLAHRLLTYPLADRASVDITESPYELAQVVLQGLTQAIRELSRPIDAIKHQAKTVTVGISRPSPTLTGAIGQIFRSLQIDPTLVLWRNLSYLIAAEPLIAKVKGAILYRVEGIEPDGQIGAQSHIYKESATGIAAVLPSRTEQDHSLRGSKWLALKKNAVLIGTGRNDDRQIAIIPLRGKTNQEARILLLHIAYNEAATLHERLQLLRTRGPVYDQFRASVTEINRIWSDDLLLTCPIPALFDDTPDRFLAALQPTPAPATP